MSGSTVPTASADARDEPLMREIEPTLRISKPPLTDVFTFVNTVRAARAEGFKILPNPFFDDASGPPHHRDAALAG